MPSARAFGCAVVLVVAITAPRPVSPAPGDLAECVVDLESRPRVAQRVRLIRPESCQRSPYSEPPGSGKLSHPGSPILSQAGSPMLSHPGAGIVSHPAGGDRTSWC